MTLTISPSSRVHGSAFPHPANCTKCQHEHRCPECGNSAGYSMKARLRHGVGRCTPASRPSDPTPMELERAVEAAVSRAERWLLARLTATRAERPHGGACGFQSIDELRAFAVSETRQALHATPNIGMMLRLELAVRNLYGPLSLMCAKVEGSAHA